MLEVSVTNLWPNRLIGDEHFPADYEYSVVHASTPGGIAAIPDWFREGKPMPAGKRVAFATWKHYGADAPLLDSGLLGPVHRSEEHTSELPSLMRHSYAVSCLH